MRNLYLFRPPILQPIVIFAIILLFSGMQTIIAQNVLSIKPIGAKMLYREYASSTSRRVMSSPLIIPNIFSYRLRHKNSSLRQPSCSVIHPGTDSPPKFTTMGRFPHEGGYTETFIYGVAEIHRWVRNTATSRPIPLSEKS